MRRAAFAIAAWAALGSAASALDAHWVETSFPERAFDFGTVARGSKVRHAFTIRNTTGEDLHILDYRTKCGCTEVKLGARNLPPGTQTTVEAVIDTTKFQGYKASGLTLILDKPTFAEVDLNLTCFIRGDVLLDPGQVDFGTVPRKSKPEVTLTLTYAGAQPDWAVTKMQTVSPLVAATLRELGRAPGGAAQYQLSAVLDPAAPPGPFKDEIVLLTNDPTSPRIPISVAANVQAAVTVSPSILNLGRLRPGQVVKKTILVRSGRPFKVAEVKPQKPDLALALPSDAAQAAHALSLTFTAPAKAGPYNAAVEIVTDLKDEPPARVTTFATITP